MPLDFHALFFILRNGRPDLDLYLLGSLLADDQTVFFTDIGHNCFIELHTASPQQLTSHDAIHCDHRRLGCPAPQAQDHVARGRANRQINANGGGQRLLDQEHFAAARLQRCLVNSPALHTGNPIWNSDHHLWAEERHRTANLF